MCSRMQGVPAPSFAFVELTETLPSNVFHSQCQVAFQNEFPGTLWQVTAMTIAKRKMWILTMNAQQTHCNVCLWVCDRLPIVAIVMAVKSMDFVS